MANQALFLLFLLLTAQAKAAFQCDKAMSHLRASSFSGERIEAYRQEYLANRATLPQNDPEQIIAWAEVHSNPISENSLLRVHPELLHDRKIKKLWSQLRRLHGKSQLSIATVESVFSHLYYLNNKKIRIMVWNAFVGDDKREAREEQLALSSIQGKLAVKGVVQAFQEAGLLRGPSTLDRFRSLYLKDENNVRVALSLALDIPFLIKPMNGAFQILTPLKLIKIEEIPEDILQRIYLYGESEISVWLHSLAGAKMMSDAQLEYRYNLAASLYTTLMLTKLVAVYALFSEDVADQTHDKKPLQGTMDYLNQIIDAVPIQVQTYDLAQRLFIQKYGRSPTKQENAASRESLYRNWEDGMIHQSGRSPTDAEAHDFNQLLDQVEYRDAKLIQHKIDHSH